MQTVLRCSTVLFAGRRLGWATSGGARWPPFQRRIGGSWPRCSPGHCMQFNQDPGFSSGYAALKHLGTRQKSPRWPRSGMNYGQAGHGANLQLLYVTVGGRSTSLNTM